MATPFADVDETFENSDESYWNGDYEQAKLRYQLVLHRSDLSSSHLVRCHRSLAATCVKLKDYEAAMIHCLSTFEALRSSTPIDCINALTSIAMIFWCQRDYQAAIDYQNCALERLRNMPETDDLRARVCKNLANLHTKINDFTSALTYFEQALEIDRERLAPDHPQFGQTYANMGAMYYAQKDYSKALKYLCEALDTWRRSFPRTHICIETIENTIKRISLERARTYSCVNGSNANSSCRCPGQLESRIQHQLTCPLQALQDQVQALEEKGRRQQMRLDELENLRERLWDRHEDAQGLQRTGTASAAPDATCEVCTAAMCQRDHRPRAGTKHICHTATQTTQCLCPCHR